MASQLTGRFRANSHVLHWWSWLPRRRYHIAARVEAADLVPVRLPRKALVIVESGADPSWVAFDCPCRRKHRLLIRLEAGDRPSWRLTGLRAPSLAPSIDSHDRGRRCHFWLVNGRVLWVQHPDRMEMMA
jgi:Family of unknown function (DUF6527)